MSIYAYVDLLICWLNNTSHFDAENTVLPPCKLISQRLLNTDSDRSVNTYHLDIGAIMHRFN